MVKVLASSLFSLSIFVCRYKNNKPYNNPDKAPVNADYYDKNRCGSWLQSVAFGRLRTKGNHLISSIYADLTGIDGFV